MDVDTLPRRLLVIKLADLGDTLLCEPALRSLRAAFPHARIDVLTSPSSVALIDLIGHDLHAIPFPKHLFDRPASLADPRAQARAARLAIRLRTARYDRVILLHHLTTAFGARKFSALVQATGCGYVAGLDNGRGAFLTHRVTDDGFGARHEAAYMRDIAVAADGVPVDAVPVVTPRATEILDVQLPERFAAIFPVTGPYSSAREWPATRFGEVAIALRRNGLASVIVGGEDATAAAAIIRSAEMTAMDLTGRTTLTNLASVLDRATVVVGGDSFIGHLAAALGRPVVSIFGPSNADAWRPVGSVDAGHPLEIDCRSIVVRSDLPCMPCLYTGFRLGRPEGCPDRTCLKRVTTGDVTSAIDRILGVA